MIDHSHPKRTRDRRDSGIVEGVVRFVEEHYHDPISLRDVARAVGYSACHLTTAFRRKTGTSVTAWIMIAAAEMLLAEGCADVRSVCERTGFSDQRYFTRQFVRYVGTTPRQFCSAKRDGDA